ncbi:endonuclease/exonuclease/phosphatase family protein [Salegentibacter salinarum]|uniref:endonuclease/exonuclease/phosphatase family protein n=1 Tax=Salegentibacter salinarum TaxID=447422 RepID=UPI0021D15E3D|nr:endonuclease/exonuclease/phosphatase family protein [Salegentibacter salinarum]
MDSQRTNTNRLLQMKELATITSEEKLPMIVAGDFNAPPNSKVINILEKNFTRTCTSCEPTIPVQNPVKAIDFIALKSKEIFSIKCHKVINEIYASDHLPILAVLKVKQLQTLSK